MPSHKYDERLMIQRGFAQAIHKAWDKICQEGGNPKTLLVAPDVKRILCFDYTNQWRPAAVTHAQIANDSPVVTVFEGEWGALRVEVDRALKRAEWKVVS